MPTSTLTSKGQITLPKAVRQRRVHAGDVVEFVIEADGDIRVRAGSVDVSALRGMLHKPRPTSVRKPGSRAEYFSGPGGEDVGRVPRGVFSCASVLASRSKAHDALAILRKGVRQDLDCDRAPEVGIDDAIYLAHPASAEGGEDLIRPEACAGAQHWSGVRRRWGKERTKDQRPETGDGQAAPSSVSITSCL